METCAFDTLPAGSTLKACGPQGVAALAAHWTEAVYSARTPIVTVDEPEDDVFFVLSGLVRAASYSASGKPVLYNDLHPGEIFGLIAAFDGGPRSTNIVAVAESRIARMSAGRFNAIVDENSEVRRAMLVHMAELVRSLSVRLADIATRNARQRLIAELLNLARTEPGHPDQGRIDPLPTQQELALLIFSQRETVGRDLSKLKEMGLIDRDGRTMVLKSLSKLRALLDCE